MGGSSSSHTTGSPAYVHANRHVPYRSEKLELSSHENTVLKELRENSACFEPSTQQAWPTTEHPVLLIMDTDLGTDVDDSLALLLLLHLPETDVKLLGVCLLNTRR